MFLCVVPRRPFRGVSLHLRDKLKIFVKQGHRVEMLAKVTKPRSERKLLPRYSEIH